MRTDQGKTTVDKTWSEILSCEWVQLQSEGSPAEASKDCRGSRNLGGDHRVDLVAVIPLVVGETCFGGSCCSGNDRSKFWETFPLFCFLRYGLQTEVWLTC
jgi:hypothetical protein